MTGLRQLFGVVAVVAWGTVAGAQTPESRYLLQPSDVLTIRYLYTPEYDATVAVQPDGYVSAPIVGELKVGGLSLAAARTALLAAANRRLREPEMYVDLKEFEKPHFSVGGEVGTPGRFELRGRITVLDAIAMAGGLKPSSKHSQVVLLRSVDRDRAEATLLDVKRLMTLRGAPANASLGPGDVLIVPQNRVSKVERYVRWANVGLFLNPFDISSR